MTRAYIGAGSNLGDRAAMLAKARDRLCANRFILFRKSSRVYETEPSGFLPQGMFLNAVWELESDLPPEALLRELLAAERFLYRARAFSAGPRTIDLDLLDFGGRLSVSKALVLPHPRLHRRLFVLRPLCDVNPEWIHPLYQLSAQELLRRLVHPRNKLAVHTAR
jgi:2-amino-4-hydroxy-6-hydroxymethyldihydropteridine diphosphokinase